MTKPKPKPKPPVTAPPPEKFNELLSWHMASGTQPHVGIGGEPWRSDLLAKATRCDTASLRNWRAGQSLPVQRHVGGLVNAFFGDNPSLLRSRETFLQSWRMGCLEVNARNVQRSAAAFYKNSAPHPGTITKDDARTYVIAHLSAMCRALNIPLSGIEDAARHLLK